MLGEHIRAALTRAEYIPLEDGTFAAHVEGIRGVISTGPTAEECRDDFIEVIEKRMTIRLVWGLVVPTLDGHTIEVSRESIAVV